MGTAATARRVVMRMHYDGVCYWADSDDVPGYAATASDALGVMALVDEAVALGFIGPGEEVDLRWHPCGDPQLGIVAVRATHGPPSAPRPCPCADLT